MRPELPCNSLFENTYPPTAEGLFRVLRSDLPTKVIWQQTVHFIQDHGVRPEERHYRTAELNYDKPILLKYLRKFITPQTQESPIPYNTQNDSFANLVRRGNLQEVMAAVKRGENIHSSHEGKSPLQVAVECSHYKVVEFLLKCGACINDTLSPLHTAVSNRNIPITKLLLAYGAEVDEATLELGRKSGNQGLLTCLQDTNKNLCSYGRPLKAARLSKKQQLAAPLPENEEEESLFYRNATIKTFTCDHSLEQKYPPNGYGLLRILSAKKSEAEIKGYVIHLLDDHHVQPKRSHYNTVFSRPLGPEILQLLVSKGERPTYALCKEMMSKYWRGYDYFAIFTQYLSEEEKEELTIKYQPPLPLSRPSSCKRTNGNPSIRTLIMFGSLDSVKKAVAQGADVNDGHGSRSPLHEAVLQSIGTAKFLLSQGARVNACDSEGITPLHTAVVQEDLPMVKLLLQCGADKHAKSKVTDETRWVYGSPMDIARRTGNNVLISLLEDEVNSPLPERERMRLRSFTAYPNPPTSSIWRNVTSLFSCTGVQKHIKTD